MYSFDKVQNAWNYLSVTRSFSSGIPTIILFLQSFFVNQSKSINHKTSGFGQIQTRFKFLKT
ncbi:MAG: hypothetical protein DRI89_11235 [Bacteroidetes bacterium]|nr:MAG: hypothetical protein DRI89_11235 [Bacteroidota bacterium]